MKIIFLAASLVMSAVTVAAEGEPRISKGKKFVHPGIFYTEGDFGRMKAMVAAGREPWKKSFEALRFSPYANSGAWARPRGGKIEQGREKTKAIAYRNPDGEIIVVITNWANGEKRVSFAVAGKTYTVNLKPHSFNTFRIGL